MIKQKKTISWEFEMFCLCAFLTLVNTNIINTLITFKSEYHLRALMLIFKIHVALNCFPTRKSEEILLLIYKCFKISQPIWDFEVLRSTLK